MDVDRVVVAGVVALLGLRFQLECVPEGTARLADEIDIPVIVSGGVASEEDVVAAAGYASRGVAGIIVGRAIYTGALELGSALARIAC